MSRHAEAESDTARIIPLRAVEPGCYNRLVSEMEALHLHPYDIMAGVVIGNPEVTVILRYGSELSHEEQRCFPLAALQRMDDELIAFFRQTGEKCSRALVADYYRLMKP